MVFVSLNAGLQGTGYAVFFRLFYVRVGLIR